MSHASVLGFFQPSHKTGALTNLCLIALSSQCFQKGNLVYCRALEASAEENAARMKRKRSEAQSEMCSPGDWIRQDDWPVGIRNVGNTCWFSAVIQVRMRRMIGYIKLMRICPEK